MNETTKRTDPLDSPYNPIISIGTDDRGNEIEVMDNRDGTYTNLYSEKVIDDWYTCRVYARWFDQQLKCGHPDDKRKMVPTAIDYPVSASGGDVEYVQRIEYVAKCQICGKVVEE